MLAVAFVRHVSVLNAQEAQKRERLVHLLLVHDLTVVLELQQRPHVFAPRHWRERGRTLKRAEELVQPPLPRLVQREPVCDARVHVAQLQDGVVRGQNLGDRPLPSRLRAGGRLEPADVLAHDLPDAVAQQGRQPSEHRLSQRSELAGELKLLLGVRTRADLHE